MIDVIRKAGRFLLYGGFRRPRPYEARVLDATVAALPEADAAALSRQIASIERVQRWSEDRMVIVGFADRGRVPKLRDEATDNCLAKLRVKGDFGSIAANVMTHRGILSTIEFRPSPRRIRDRGFSVELVTLHPDDPGISSALDEEEHGDPA